MIIKMKNAPPASAERAAAAYELIQSSLLKKMYCGMICTCAGSMSVSIMQVNQKPRPGKRMRAKPYATTADDSTMSSVPTPA